MFTLWMVGFVLSILVGLGTLFLIKKGISRRDVVFIVLVSFLLGWGYTSLMFVPLNPSVYIFWDYVLFQVLVIYLPIAVIISGLEEEINFSSYRILIGIVLGISLILVISSSSFTRSGTVSSLVQFKEVDSSLFREIEPKRVRLVPKRTAITLAEKTLGSVSRNGVVLGSQLQVDTDHTTIQKIKNSLFWVVPLEYKGIFKQLSFGDIPGFILVDAYDPNKVAIFKDGYKIKYSLNGSFSRWAKRRLWLDDITKILDDFSFEVDDDLNPYIVATILKPQVGFAKLMPVGVKILNLQTGDIKTYSMDKIPYWVDRVVPEKIISERINEKGIWHNGIISALITKKGIWQLTDYDGTNEMFFIEDGSGNTYWVSGVTSIGQDQSIIALVAVNTRTGKAYWINTTGPTEQAVVDVVESSLGVNKSVWEAQLPILYNIYGKLVWVSVVVDEDRAYPIRYALVDSSNISHYVVDSTFSKALLSFFEKTLVPGIKKEVYTYSGYIYRYSIDTGFLYFWADKHVWKCSIRSIPTCSVVQKGDKLKVKGFKKGGVIMVESFENKSLK